MRPTACCLTLLLLVTAHRIVAQAGATSDSAYAAMQQRGGGVMGVDQQASEHIFEDLGDGGRILFRMRDTSDMAGAAIIRHHLRAIADSFAAGSFQGPAEVHGLALPGTEEMTRLRGSIRYQMREVPAGGELAISSSDATAVAAIHAFLAFQRMDHRAGGHDPTHH